MSKLYKKFMIFNRDENSQQITAVRQIYANFTTQRIHDFRLALFIVSDVTPCSTNQTTGNVQTSLDSSDFKYPTSNISTASDCSVHSYTQYYIRLHALVAQLIKLKFIMNRHLTDFQRSFLGSVIVSSLFSFSRCLLNLTSILL